MSYRNLFKVLWMEKMCVYLLMDRQAVEKLLPCKEDLAIKMLGLFPEALNLFSTKWKELKNFNGKLKYAWWSNKSIYRTFKICWMSTTKIHKNPPQKSSSNPLNKPTPFYSKPQKIEKWLKLAAMSTPRDHISYSESILTWKMQIINKNKEMVH